MSRILVAGFCSFPGPDRPGVQLRHVVRALLRGNQVDVLAARRGDQAYVERWSGARLLRVPIPEGPLMVRIEAFRRALRRQLEGADYHAVHVRDGFAGQVALELSGRLKLAVVFDATRAPLSEPRVLEPEAAAVAEPVEAELLERADLVLVGSEMARRVLAERTRGERIHVVPPGVDVDAFDFEEAPRGRPRVLYAGALSPGRGVRVLVRSMIEVATKVDAELILAGPSAPGFVDGLRAAIRELDLASRVTLVGEVAHEQLPALIASAQVCVAPSAVELGPLPTALYPTKLLEYMACQRAVVAPRRGAVTMLIRDEQHGLLYEPGQPFDLADKLIRLLRDEPFRTGLARAGYELVRRSHTASGTRRELHKAYAWLAGQPAWHARFTEAVEDLPTAELPGALTGDVSDAGAFARRSARTSTPRPINAFDDGIAIDDDADEPVDTGMTEGFGEVTTVEGPSSVGFDERVATAYQPLSTSVDGAPLGDDWVVEDSRSRESAFGDRTGSHPPGRGFADRSPGPLGSRFVAGELDDSVPPAVRPPIELDQAFVAMAPPLGFAPATAVRAISSADTSEIQARSGARQDPAPMGRSPDEPPIRK